MVLQQLEREIEQNANLSEIESDRQSASDELAMLGNTSGKFKGILNALPTITDDDSKLRGLLQPQFWGYYAKPWGQNFFYDFHDPYNDQITIIDGPRGGGKTISGATISIVDGQMRGIPLVSNVPISWIARDIKGNLYKVESIPFEVEKFAKGDRSFMYKRLLLDEANYLADRLRSTSSKNLAMSDILQQARKFRMSVVFCTINSQWIDPRVAGSLADITIQCNDLYYDHYLRKRYGLKKGMRIAWDCIDVSGKITGSRFFEMDGRTLNAREMWGTFDTLNFVDPVEARRKLSMHDKTVVNENGEEVSRKEWMENKLTQLSQLAKTDREWPAGDLFESIGLGPENRGLRVVLGSFMKQAGITKRQNYTGENLYDLSVLFETKAVTA